MAEVFQGEPVLVSVRIDGPDGRMKQYHVAGRDLSDVAEAVRLALIALPDEDAPAKPKKARKPRRTKKEMVAARDADGVPYDDAVPTESHRKTRNQAAVNGDVPPAHETRAKAWA